jgi:hypothetical protein
MIPLSDIVTDRRIKKKTIDYRIFAPECIEIEDMSFTTPKKGTLDG